MQNFVMIAIVVVLLLTVGLLNNRRSGYYVISKIKKGEHFGMVNMINVLIGKRVKIKDIVLGVTYVGEIVEVEDKWLKLETHSKKGVSTHIIALDSVGSIQY